MSNIYRDIYKIHKFVESSPMFSILKTLQPLDFQAEYMIITRSSNSTYEPKIKGIELELGPG